jgi:Zn-dependent protease with chaperone function
MQFLLLFIFGLICWQNEQSLPDHDSLWPDGPSWLPPLGSAALSAGMVLLAWLAADLVTRLYCWRLVRAPWRRGPLLQGFARVRRYLTLGLLVGFLALLYEMGWGRLVEDAWRTATQRFPGAELIMIVPLLVALFLTWERFYYLEKTSFELNHFGDRFLGKRNYLVLQLRNNLLIVVPPACLWLAQQSVALLLPADDGRPWLMLLYFTMLALALLSLPLLLRVFLGLRPLPAGPLRTRLEETARRLRFRCGNILVWDTHLTMANALISGFLRWPRYVVLTDRLLEELTPEEIEAVFAHEVGHVRHHHMTLYVLFCLSSLVLLGAAGGYLRNLAQPFLEPYLNPWPGEAALASMVGYFGAPQGPAPMLVMPSLLYNNAPARISLLTAGNVLTVCLVALYFLFVFGLLSRYCERQADLFGSRVTSSQAFISALEKVAHINGMPRDHAGWFASWRHPSIAQRVDFVQRASADPRLASRFHLSLRIFKVALAVALPCLLVAVWWLVGPDKVLQLVSAM